MHVFVHRRAFSDLASASARYAQSANAIPFAQASYTLRVYDERGIDAVATAGYFNGANSIVNFALYSPAAYTPLASGEFPSCLPPPTDSRSRTAR